MLKTKSSIFFVTFSLCCIMTFACLKAVEASDQPAQTPAPKVVNGYKKLYEHLKTKACSTLVSSPCLSAISEQPVLTVASKIVFPCVNNLSEENWTSVKERMAVFFNGSVDLKKMSMSDQKVFMGEVMENFGLPIGCPPMAGLYSNNMLIHFMQLTDHLLTNHAKEDHFKIVHHVTKIPLPTEPQ